MQSGEVEGDVGVGTLFGGVEGDGFGVLLVEGGGGEDGEGLGGHCSCEAHGAALHGEAAVGGEDGFDDVVSWGEAGDAELAEVVGKGKESASAAHGVDPDQHGELGWEILLFGFGGDEGDHGAGDGRTVVPAGVAGDGGSAVDGDFGLAGVVGGDVDAGCAGDGFVRVVAGLDGGLHEVRGLDVAGDRGEDVVVSGVGAGGTEATVDVGLGGDHFEVVHHLEGGGGLLLDVRVGVGVGGRGFGGDADEGDLGEAGGSLGVGADDVTGDGTGGRGRGLLGGGSGKQNGGETEDGQKRPEGGGVHGDTIPSTSGYWSECGRCCILRGVAFLSEAGSYQATDARVRPASGVSALAGWHLLSLDAPTVAAVWTWFIARAVGVELGWRDVAAMFVAVWVLYATDRLLDARLLGCGTEVSGLEARHWFHHEHRVAFRWGIAIGCVALAALLPSLMGAELRLYAVLGALLAGWFLAIHTAGRVRARPLPKEAVVGVFFAAAVFIPTVARAPWMRGELIVPAVLFGAVCSLNCLFIFAWEHEGMDDFEAHASTRWAARWVGRMGVGLMVVCFVFGGSLITTAVGLSAGLLVAVHLVRGRVERMTLRALADLVLLTPVVVGMWMR